MDFNEMFKNLGNMKARVEEIRQRVARMHIVGEAGAGMVKVTVSGEGFVENVAIDRNMFRPEDNEMLEELIISATNDALQKSRETLAHEMNAITGGLNIPGLEKLFGG